MRLTAGSRLGPYDIHSAIGAGGMGEVYRATDRNLAREVAIKVLPEAFALDAERLARFEREARTLASISHPNIAIVHGLERADPTGSGQTISALVMELVEGPTLADLLVERGRGLPIDEALAIARQIAEGLEAAHEQGIVHRDLKPANVKIRHDGTVKVLDFGLAKTADAVHAISPGLSASPTITTPAMTQAGLVLGTAAYMSPEQAKGRGADKRSDVWSFGAVLYEMLTGRRAFDGDDVSDTMASVLKSEPDWSKLPADTPTAVATLLKGCLVKDRRQRVSDMSTAKFVLRELSAIGATSGAVAPALNARSRWSRAIPIAIAVALTAIVVGTTAWMLQPTVRPPVVARFAFATEGPFTSVVQQTLAVSPDGTRVAYSATGHLRVRSIGELESRALTDENIIALNPLFAPDGESIVFATQSATGPTLERIPVVGGPATTMAAFPGIVNVSGMTWGRDGILIGSAVGGGIFRVPSAGGTAELIVSIAADETAHRPQMLPDGHTVLFTLAKSAGEDRWDKAEIVAQSLPGASRRVLIKGATDGRYVETGHLLYTVGGTVYAVPFDAGTITVSGAAVPVIVGVRRVTGGTNGATQFAISETGTMAYLPGPATTQSVSLGLLIGDGRNDPVPLKVPVGVYAHPRVSPNGRLLAVSKHEGSASDIWTYELSGSAEMQRLTFGGRSRLPIWSADGRRVTFQSAQDRAIWWQAVDGGTAERLTTPTDGEEHAPESWSPDGTRLLFSVQKESMNTLWMLTLNGRKTEPIGQVQSLESLSASFSPDGTWIAYAASDRLGGAQSPNRGVFVEPFPPTGTKRQAPKKFLDYHPRWSPDGKSIVYVPGAGRALVSVPVTMQPSLVFGTPVDMPRAPMPGLLSLQLRGYDLLPDGRIVSVASAPNQNAFGSTSEVRVVLNWTAELKRLVPAK
jgi:serine/threonine-protein kinase